MMDLKYDIKNVDILKNILLRLRHGESGKSVQQAFDCYFENISIVEILLIGYELINGDYGITVEDMTRLSSVNPYLLEGLKLQEDLLDGHPILIFQEENIVFHSSLNKIKAHIESLAKNPQNIEMITEKIKELMTQLGGVYSHYNRKEKLFFPIMERYGHYTLPRVMWKMDDRIRGLYQAAKRRIEKLPDIDNKLVQKTFEAFEKEFKEMQFQEESILLPIAQSIFNEDDWAQIANESDAFGFARLESEERRSKKHSSGQHNKVEKVTDLDTTSRNLPFGGGYLTTKEANLILNNLPVEITFVDKNGLFKYFNERTASTDMILVRTPLSIGRNVANCHPPKSMKKVMRLIRDLKTKKRSSESMWFKKGDHFVHITYTGVFDDDGEYLGILECVQDIQPFMDLPRDAKRGISRMDD